MSPKAKPAKQPQTSFRDELRSIAEGFRAWLPQWEVAWRIGWGRVRHWGLPPRWSWHAWRDEIRDVAVAATLEAIRQFKPGRGVPLESFVAERTRHAALARYRQEWAYARGLKPGAHPDGLPQPDRDRVSTEEEAIRELLSQLPGRDRSFMEEIFFSGRTETEIAAKLRKSPSWVSKCKSSILKELRRIAKRNAGE
jgi:DNA-directed RNA polymerase specialized sigma24 family protein